MSTAMVHLTRIFAVFAASAALCACAGTRSATPPLPASDPALQARNATGLPAVVFVNDFKTGAISELSAADLGARPIAKITEGLHGPEGMAVDSSGTLYVVNNAAGSVAEFHAGQTSPFTSITAGLSHPEQIALAADGTIAVSNNGNQEKRASLVIFDKGSAAPTRTVRIPLDGNLVVFLNGVAIDANDDVFIAVRRYPKGPNAIYEVASGTSALVTTGILFGTLGGFDSAGNLYVGYTQAIASYAPGSASATRVIKKGTVSVGLFTVLPDGTLYVPNEEHYVEGLPARGNVVEYAPGASAPTAKNATDADIYPISTAFRPAM